MTGYDFTHQGSRKEIDGTLVEIYTFKATLVNQTYIAEILILSHNIYIIQFFLKNHRLSYYRFNSLLNGNNNSHAFYVLNTLVNISKLIVKKDPIASFGFMGAPLRKESSRKKNSVNINADNTVKNTKRYRTYSLYVKRYYPPDMFLHIEYKNSSCYLLKNINNYNLTENISNIYLNELIEKKNNYIT